MIVGKGMVAGALKDISGWDNDIIFSSGVSNSGEKNEKNFQKEVDLVKSNLARLTSNGSFVYFSTTSIFNPLKKSNPYVLHKLKIEKLINDSNLNYLIIRLPNLVGTSANPNTLTNYFADSIRLGRAINLNQKAFRHLIDTSDLPGILNDIKNNFGKNKYIINIETDKPISAQKIILCIEDAIQKKAIINPSAESEDLEKIDSHIGDTSINYIWKIRDDYHKSLLKKYYSI